MAITVAQIEALPTYTAQHQLKMWEVASIELAASGQSYAVNGRSLTRSDWQEVQNALQYWQGVVNAEAAGEAGGGIVLARRGNPS